MPSVSRRNDETKQQKSPGDYRLEGFLTFLTVFGITIGVSATLIIGSFFYPRTIGLYAALPYYTYILLLSRPEVNDGARWEWFSRNFFVFRVMRKFFAMKLVVVNDKLKVAEAKKGAQFIFAVFPHGSNADFRIALDGLLPEIIPNTYSSLRVLAATVLFRLPVVRELALWTGCVDARRSVAEALLQRGRSLLVLPGGQAEQIRTIHGREILFLQRRKGFVKLAMQHGVPVVPVYAFGVSDYYRTSNHAHDLRLWMVKSLGISIPLAWGTFGSLVCPLPVKTTIIFGEPMSFQTKKEGFPTPEELDTAHEAFCTALKDLFDKHKEELGFGKRTLEIE